MLPAFIKKFAGEIPFDHWKVIHAITNCRTALLGGHVEQCTNCAHQLISCYSCRNRHCPKCQSLAKAKWLKARSAELLPVTYFHVVFTLPHELGPLGLQNKKVFYNNLFRSAAQTMQTIAADPKHLGAQIGALAVLHTWGQNLMFHPHLHFIVPGGGISSSEANPKWTSCRPNFFLPVRVLSQLFRRLFLEGLDKAYRKGLLTFHGELKRLDDPQAFHDILQTTRLKPWVVYAKKPFGGPEKVLDYLARYTHRVAISNHRLTKFQNGRITFTLKNYRQGGQKQVLTLDGTEFMRRFLLHALPSGFMRIRPFGLLANCHRAKKLQLCRDLLGVQPVDKKSNSSSAEALTSVLELIGLHKHCTLF